MKITDENYQNNFPYFQNTIEQHEERKHKERSFYFDNSNICQIYGQTNIEKCILLLLFIICYTIAILYYYFNKIFVTLLNFCIISLLLDITNLIFFSVILYKLRKENLFEKINHWLLKFNDYLIIIKILNNTIILTLVCIYLNDDNIFYLFIGKYVIEIYFLLTSIKLFMFFPGSQLILEQSNKIIAFCKYYLLCNDIESEPESEEYNNIEEIQSFSD